MKTLQKGTLLENTYEILEEIGSGGGGVVYKARTSDYRPMWWSRRFGMKFWEK